MAVFRCTAVPGRPPCSPFVVRSLSYALDRAVRMAGWGGCGGGDLPQGASRLRHLALSIADVTYGDTAVGPSSSSADSAVPDHPCRNLAVATLGVDPDDVDALGTQAIDR